MFIIQVQTYDAVHYYDMELQIGLKSRFSYVRISEFRNSNFRYQKISVNDHFLMSKKSFSDIGKSFTDMKNQLMIY